MAVQAQLYPERLGLLPMGGQQDCILNDHVSEFDADWGFAFQEPQQQNLFLDQNSSQNFCFDCNIGASSTSSSYSTTCDGSFSMFLSQCLDVQLDMQRREVDCMLQLQAERLRFALQQQRKQQLGIILKSVESKVSSLIRQNEEDLAQATKKTMELEVCLRKVEQESEQWQRLAREKEAVVVDLSNTLEQIRERLVTTSNKVQDAESFCCGSCDIEQVESQKRVVCKGCNSRTSCVIFLPCRHLCSCKFCEAFLGSCPVCKSAKEASMEVFWV
ncbi:PREDICTED: probable BOI-related E3 ubiquitin-protein ligase 2 [Populus euphratica]|uniref:Probable BOI-related E3 ubiquitin-protein ligase 2 n=1 Tax=Populus euphratica TaxID=75702 RepID=A0AAJ6XY03_POPEU|nr:PREDICTED: probable BOI-related E3 ubiquitin-protein ligase 2 [Populus euphratica]